MADYATHETSNRGIALIIGGIVLALVLLYVVIAAGNGSTNGDPANFVEPATQTAPIVDETQPVAPTIIE